MTDYVFDTEPLIAYFYGETGADEVRERLEAIENEEVAAAIAHVTAAEVMYKIARLETGRPNEIAPTEDELAVGERDVRVLQGFGVTIETPPWRLAGRIKAPGGISIGDAYAAALAAAEDATLVVGADSEFDDLAVDVDLHRIREDPV